MQDRPTRLRRVPLRSLALAALAAIGLSAAVAAPNAHASSKLLLVQSPDHYDQGGGYANLAITDPDEPGTTTALAACSSTMVRPAPSPDGTKILFTAVAMSAPGREASPTLQVYDTASCVA